MLKRFLRKRVITPVDPRVTIKANASGAPPKLVATSARAMTELCVYLLRVLTKA